VSVNLHVVALNMLGKVELRVYAFSVEIRDFGFSPTFNADEDLLDWMGFLGFRVFVFFKNLVNI